MDFHGLNRKQLQALCKTNKIPANLTNVAMANALSALDNVEGIEEIMQPQGLEGEETGSPEGQRTITRTMTRDRKPPVKVLESGGALSRSKARTNRKLVDDDDLIVNEEMNVEKTPAVASSRQCLPIAACRKVEAPSVHKVYSTRRSVRLVEKQLSELCLGENKTERRPIKIDNELFSGMTESDVNAYNHVVNEVIDDKVNSKNMVALVETIDNAAVAEENKVSSIVEVVDVAMANAEEEVVALKIAVDHEKETHLDIEFESVETPEASSVKALANPNEHDSIDGSKNEDSTENSIFAKEKIENVQISNDIDLVLSSSESMLVTVEKKIDTECPTSELITDTVKELPHIETENVNKENAVKDTFKVPKEVLKDCSLRQLKKLMKGMNICETGEKDKKGDANKFQHQDSPRPTRPALDILPVNIGI